MKWRALYCLIDGKYAYLEGEDTSDERMKEAIEWWSQGTWFTEWKHWDDKEQAGRHWFCVEIDDEDL